MTDVPDLPTAMRWAVGYVAARYGHEKIDADVRQELAVVAWQALRTYDPARGVTFAAYLATRSRWRYAELVRERLGRGGARASVYNAVPFEDTGTLADAAVADIATTVCDRVALTAALAALPAREREVVVETIVHGRYLDDVAAAWGVSRARVSQVRSKALDRLRVLVPA